MSSLFDEMAALVTSHHCIRHSVEIKIRAGYRQIIICHPTYIFHLPILFCVCL